MADYAIRICFGWEPGLTPLKARPPTTRECEPHEPEPSGYSAKHEWMGWMVRTSHVQRRCPGCKLYLIWAPSEARANA